MYKQEFSFLLIQQIDIYRISKFAGTQISGAPIQFVFLGIGGEVQSQFKLAQTKLFEKGFKKKSSGSFITCFLPCEKKATW